MKRIVLKLLKRLVCFMEGHDWETIYDLDHNGYSVMGKYCNVCDKRN
jgi:hypothetical protein